MLSTEARGILVIHPRLFTAWDENCSTMVEISDHRDPRLALYSAAGPMVSLVNGVSLWLIF